MPHGVRQAVNALTNHIREEQPDHPPRYQQSAHPCKDHERPLALNLGGLGGNADSDVQQSQDRLTPGVAPETLRGATDRSEDTHCLLP